VYPGDIVLGKTRRVHFVGIGGIGMSGIAELLANLGYGVSGSDARRSEITDRLASLGATIHVGHRPEQVGDADVVVYSSAVRDDNPEVLEARRRRIPVIPRAEMLAELMRLRSGIAVAGAHGKTSTTSMIALVLERAGLDPTAVIGGRLSAFGSNARLGRGAWMVAEADESDRSFLKLSPAIAVITNVDREHMDAYGSFAELQQAFVDFANKVPFYGAVVASANDCVLASLGSKFTRRVIWYGVDAADADVAAANVELSGFGSSCRVIVRPPQSPGAARVLGELRLQVPGQHSVQNALAAVAVGLELDVPFPTIAGALADFAGAERRFERRGPVGGVTLVDDYGHHPTEIRATLEALRTLAGQRRSVVLFQPHRYTRTRFLWDEFCRCFPQADVLLLTDVYAAGEAPIEGISSESLAAALAAGGHPRAEWAGGLEQAGERLAQVVREGDVVLTLGAGSVWLAGEELLRRLRKWTPA
jgi:UDP-N-acetylmuramate--alanine ligase